MNARTRPIEQVPKSASTSMTVPALGDAKGVVYTKPWVVDLMLDLAGYRSEIDLASSYSVEPSAGEGAFLLPMVSRLVTSLQLHSRPLMDGKGALHAYELDEVSAKKATAHVCEELVRRGASKAEAESLSKAWITIGDYLLESPNDRAADFVVGNPPYIRYDDLDSEALARYRTIYPTMIGRGDIYIGFIEAALRQLAPQGAMTFICADRWMRSAYGAELRDYVGRSFGVEVVVEMHNAPAFANDVAAYPAVIVIRRSLQGEVLVASANAEAGEVSESTDLASRVRGLSSGNGEVQGFTATRAQQWFNGKGPWPALDPERLELLQYLESNFEPIESEVTKTKVGIGVATGNDGVFITNDKELVEESRLLPLAMSGDTSSGEMRWSGHYLVNPWNEERGLVQLSEFPKLAAYFENNATDLRSRHVAGKNVHHWFRTIDRVNHDLTGRDKIYFPDMKGFSHPVLDRGKTYPHHNLYFVTSDTWDMEVLGGLLLSKIAQLFIEAYCVRMRNGTLRFQSQYLRRIRVPDASTISLELTEALVSAFRARDARAATSAAVVAYRAQKWQDLLV